MPTVRIPLTLSWYSSNLAFSPGISLETKWCNHTVVLILATDWKNSYFIQSERPDFHMINKLSIAVHTLPMHMLTLLRRNMKRSTNFRGLPFNE